MYVMYVYYVMYVCMYGYVIRCKRTVLSQTVLYCIWFPAWRQKLKNRGTLVQGTWSS